MAKQKASERVHFYENPNGPVIGDCGKGVIKKDGLTFKDIDGSGELTPCKDWRLPPEERAKALTAAMTTEEKVGQLFVNSWEMGQEQEDKAFVDETGLLDEKPVEKGNSIFATQTTNGTTRLFKDWHGRHLILRADPQPDALADWVNELNALAEEEPRFLPAMVVSNSRNERGEVVFGMNDAAAGVFVSWPGTMGIAAAVKGDSYAIIDRFADCIRREWDAVGLKKGYMYMADVLTDPRWQRTFGTFGEDTDLICEIFRRLVPGVQGGKNGVTADGVAMTAKHFPGGGARENGFDPHYAMGQWNIYATQGSLQAYHLPGFQTAADANVSSIMPYYAKPAADKSQPQTDRRGQEMPMQPVGFAFNKPFIGDLLRDQMGFTGYINSDSGIIHHMAWGMEALDGPERVGAAIWAGVDIISGSFDIEEALEAHARAYNDYYAHHPLPAGYTKEQVTLPDEALDRAVARTLREKFALGMFENPYRDPRAALAAFANPEDRVEAYRVHQKSVVLLKNDGTLPLAAGKTVYAACFDKKAEAADAATAELKKLLGAAGVSLTEDPAKADAAVLFVSPHSGEYFNATPGYLELDICENKTVPNVDEAGRPTAETHTETTLAGAARLSQIAAAVHGHGGKVVSNINFTLSWLVGNVERYSDALLAGFDTDPAATLDVIFGRYAPTGKLPITLPRGDEVIAVNPDGVCVSPNDVPGFSKDQYMPDRLKDENGKAYAYRDAAGNYYELDFGLEY